ELGLPRVAVQHVPEIPERAADLLARRLLVHVLELRLRARLPGREEGDVVPGVDESLGEEPHHPLDAAVAARWHGEPHRREQRDLHAAASTATRPSWTRTSHWRS